MGPRNKRLRPSCARAAGISEALALKMVETRLGRRSRDAGALRAHLSEKEREDFCSSRAERGAFHNALIVSTSESGNRDWSTIAFSPIDRDGRSRPGTGVVYRTVRSSHFYHQL